MQSFTRFLPRGTGASPMFLFSSNECMGETPVLRKMLLQKGVSLLAVDAVATFEVVRLQFVAGAERVPCAACLCNRAFDRFDREDVVADAVFYEQRPRREEAGEVGELAERQQARHEVTRAVEDRQDAVA